MTQLVHTWSKPYSPSAKCDRKVPESYLERNMLKTKGRKWEAALDAVSIWVWNHAHQVRVELVDFLVFNHDGYRDSSGNQPDVGVIGCYTRMMSQSNVTLS